MAYTRDGKPEPNTGILRNCARSALKPGVEALARVLAPISVSVTRVRFRKLTCAFLLASPNALWASVARSVAVARSKFPAWANSATAGSAAIDCAAVIPALAR